MSDLISRRAAITIPVTPKENREYQTYNLDDAYEQAWEDLQKKIKQLPTVEAITVEWIRKYTNHRTVEFGDVWVFINCMINDWEKENESRRNK